MIAYLNRFLSNAAILCAIAFCATAYALTPMQRGTIQDLTKQIKAGTLNPSEAREKALSLKIPANQMHDFIVQDLVTTADTKCIADILKPITAPVAQASNPAVQEIYNDYKIFSASMDNFKPSNSFTADKRSIRQVGTEFDRIIETVSALNETVLNSADQTLINELIEKLLPALFKKLLDINAEIDRQEQTKIPPVAEQKTTLKTIPANIIELTNNTYLNKEYTVEQVMNLRQKNKPAHKWGSVPANPFAALRKDEMLLRFQKDNPKKWNWESPQWDIVSVIDTYYLFYLAKIRCKELGDITCLQRVNQELVKFLSQYGDDSVLVVDVIENKTPIKNKYFIELINEFETKK